MTRPRAAVIVAIAVALLALPATARAGACGRQRSVEAAGPTLPRLGLVLVDVERSEAFVKTLEHARFVTANGQATPARIVRIEHQWRTQVLLAPTAALPADAQVHLVVGDPEYDTWLADSPLTTSTVEHAPAPRWRRAPKALKRRRASSNKGDNVDAIPVVVALEAPAFVVAHVEPRATTPASNPPSTAPGAAIYVLGKRFAKDQIEIGRIGCFSMLWLSGRFTATLAALDDDGTETAAPGAPLAIDLKR